MKPDEVSYEEFDRLRARTPERGLLAAILSRAIADVVKEFDRKNALIWLYDHEEHVPFRDDRHGFTFLEVCEALGLQAKAVLQNVKTLMAEKESRHKTIDEI